MPSLERITIHPVKSLDGLDVASARVLGSGGLEHDRRWQLIDEDGRVMHAKRSPLFSAIRSEFDLGRRIVALWVDPLALVAGALPTADLARLRGLGRGSFHLVAGEGGPNGWLSEAFGGKLRLEEDSLGGFPDDREAPGPTLVSTATLVAVARWFGLDPEETRRRFRANLEIADCDPFWEETLVGREFAVGITRWIAANVCRRCVVPTRDSRTGAVTDHFRTVFEAGRKQGIRPDSQASSWQHYYRLALNTRLPQGISVGTIEVGDRVTVVSP